MRRWLGTAFCARFSSSSSSKEWPDVSREQVSILEHRRPSFRGTSTVENASMNITDLSTEPGLSSLRAARARVAKSYSLFGYFLRVVVSRSCTNELELFHIEQYRGRWRIGPEGCGVGRGDLEEVEVFP